MANSETQIPSALTSDPTRLDVYNVRPWGGPTVDLTIVDGKFAKSESHVPGRPVPDGGRSIDGKGLFALPGFANAHAHADKSWWGKPWVSYGGVATTQGRIEHERTHRDEMGIPGLDVTTAVLQEFLRHGTTVMRTHIDVDLELGLRGIEVVRQAVADLGNTIATQVVAFPQDGVLRRPGVAKLLERAAQEGAEFIGGLDPATIDRDPVGQLDALFTIAEKHGVGVDVHLHDGGELGAFQIELIIDRTLRTGLQGKVTVAHGFAVGDVSPSRQADLIAGMAGAGISMTTVAPMNRSPLPLNALLDGSVPVGLGTDGIRDLWAPYGDGDILKLTTTLARISGLRYDHELVRAAQVATTLGAKFAGIENHDITVGSRADLVLLDAERTEDAVVRAPARQVVIAGGRIVVNDGDLI